MYTNKKFSSQWHKTGSSFLFEASTLEVVNLKVMQYISMNIGLEPDIRGTQSWCSQAVPLVS